MDYGGGAKKGMLSPLKLLGGGLPPATPLLPTPIESRGLSLRTGGQAVV